MSRLSEMNGPLPTHSSSILQGKTQGKLGSSGHTKASRPLYQTGLSKRRRCEPTGFVTDLSSTNLPQWRKHPLVRRSSGFNVWTPRSITKRNLLTLAKDSMAGIISDIIVLAAGTPSHRPNDGGRFRGKLEHRHLFDRSTLLTSTTRLKHHLPYPHVSRPISRCAARDTDFVANRLDSACLISPNPQYSPG